MGFHTSCNGSDIIMKNIYIILGGFFFLDRIIYESNRF